MASEHREGPKSDEEGSESREVCAECDATTFHRVLKSTEYRSEYHENSFSITSWDEYQVIECQGCRVVRFRKRHRDTEHFHGDGDDEELVEQVELYPAPMSGRSKLEGVELLPYTIHFIYSETLAALRQGLPVLTALGIRSLVEAICNDLSVLERSLENKIDALVARGVLTENGAETLHGLRIMGNLAAHEAIQPRSQDLDAALDVLEHVLEGVYLLPPRTKSFPKRKRRESGSR